MKKKIRFYKKRKGRKMNRRYAIVESDFSEDIGFVTF